ncbi:MAG TPA: MBG domain-containing protein [Candidatus Binatia bacterium]|nr:MBG domain-containing protein [Candidatus Binatia bacterium]
MFVFATVVALCCNNTSKEKPSNSHPSATGAYSSRAMRVVVWLALCFAVLALPVAARAAEQPCPASPNFTPNFNSNQYCLVLNGNAMLVTSNGTTTLQITNSSGNQAGTAWYLTPQLITNGFSTTFQFQFTNPTNPPADGIAFVVQNSSTAAIGATSDGGALAYGDADSNLNPSRGQGIPYSLAVEFDTFQNGWDPPSIGGVDSHVAIQSCGAGPNTSHHNYLCDGNSGPNSTLGQPVSTESNNINLADGGVHSVTINYTPACATCNPATVANMQVIVDGVDMYPNGVPVDFSSIVGTNGTAYVGFTGATGADWETQDILNWEFAPTQQGQQINPNNPQSLDQTTVVSSTPGQYLSFNFDDTVSNAAGTLTIQPGTTPFISTSGISQFDWATIVNGTAMADAPCFIAAGQSVCALNTMTCTTSTNSNAAGANCPQSTARNILFDQEVDVDLNQTNIVNGILTIPAGYAPGLAMAPDALVSGAECTYPSGTGLTSQLCPESIMTVLQDNSPHGGGTGTTTNSTYVFFCCEPEWQTTATIPMWNDTISVAASFTSNPPPTPNPNTNNFQAAQGESIVVGAEQHGVLLDTTYPLPGEQTLNNPVSCPALGVPPATPWSTQNPQTFSVSGTITNYDNNGTATQLTEGAYDAHYFSVDCDAFEELVFPATLDFTPGNPGPNVATFKTVQFNIDLTAPTVSYSLSPGGSVPYDSTLTASVTCTDPISNGVASGISNCGGQATSPQSAPPLTTNPTVTVTVNLPTGAAGSQSYALPAAIDQAGNQGGATNIPYIVTQVPLVITASGGTMSYGSTPPAITPGFSGFVGSDNSGSLTTQPTCTTTATSSSPVGTYPSSCTGAADPNYSISYVAGSVTVTAAPATISLSNLSQTYSGSALSPTVTTSPSGLAYSLTGAPDTNVGSYPVTATITNTNYTATPASGTFVISQAPATISLSNLTQTYSGTALSPTVTTSPTGLAYTLSGAPDTNAGSYAVTATITNTNYTANPASGTFVISPAAATITLSNLNQSYTGKPLSPSVTTLPSGLPYSLAGAPDTNIGSYPVTATITSSNYTGATSGTFVISGAVATVSPTSLNFGTVQQHHTVSKTVTLTNTGNVSMTINSIKISGGNDPDDYKQSNKCGSSLAAGANCVITVSFTPDSDNRSGSTANLVITDSAAGSPQSVSLTGKPN